VISRKSGWPPYPLLTDSSWITRGGRYPIPWTRSGRIFTIIRTSPGFLPG